MTPSGDQQDQHR